MHKKYFILVSVLTLLSNLLVAQSLDVVDCQNSKQQNLSLTTINNPALLASNLRSDTIDILKYTITLNITDFTNKTISGNTAIQFVPKLNGVSNINLDLLKLTVDSIKKGNQLLTYNYNDTLLKTNLGSAYNITDTVIVTVYYHGKPVKDPSGFGGFYFQSGYAFNIGVAFAANPHTYGRVWHPCFDNFVERSKYEFNITTNNGKVAYCNGALIKDTTDASSNRTRTWKMNEEIQTYLACVAVAAYAGVKDTYTGVNGAVPVLIAALPSDTTNLKNSFINLHSAFNTFESKYAPYAWNKVGYSLVPIASGAMEHATNISYPKILADGTTNYQTVMAHELSHHWWGDLVTCETPEDMWINEGMAAYSESIFLEGLQGTNAYKDYQRTQHEGVLHYAHIKDNGYRAVSGVPHIYTYGTTVYKKGASVAHTMRGYMGDTAFFKGLQSILNNYKFKNINSYQFRDELTNSTGIDMTDYFNDWIFKPGFPHFSIDSMYITPNSSNWDVTVYIKQKLTGTSSYFTNVPLEITFKDSAWNEVTKQILITGATDLFQFTIPVKPTFTCLNLGEKINYAVAPDYKTIKTTGAYNFSNARVTVNVTSITDSTFLRIEHNYTAPDPFKIPSTTIRLSPNHYWKIDGLLPVGFNANATIYYDGRTISAAVGGGYLDDKLIIGVEDSLVLMYRKNAADDWKIFPYYSKDYISVKTDKLGLVTLDSLWLGEYAFAMKGLFTGINNLEETNNLQINVFPNPVHDLFTLDVYNNTEKNISIELYDVLGHKIFTKQLELKNNQSIETISTLGFPKGLYLLRVISKHGATTTRIIVE